MLDDEPTGAPEAPRTTDQETTGEAATPARRSRRRAASRPAGPPEPVAAEEPAAGVKEKPAAKEAAAKPRRSRKKAASPPPEPTDAKAADAAAGPMADAVAEAEATAPAPKRTRKAKATAASATAAVLFQPPDPVTAAAVTTGAPVGDDGAADAESGDADDGDSAATRRRRRGGRSRRGRGGAEGAEAEVGDESPPAADGPTEDAEGAESTDDGEGGTTSSRRRRRRRRGSGGEAGEKAPDDPERTVVKVREPRKKSDSSITSVKGSTRLEAKKQRRREGREQGRRRPPVLTESEFLARREAVDRVMVVRQSGERTQIAVLEDDVLVEHFVTRSSSTSMAGSVFLGKVQNVLPSMEAAFVDIGRGRNAVLYAGEVNWDAAGLEGQPKRIEHALKSGGSVLVQVTKDPLGHKGARLTSQVSLPGRYLVYVPDGSMTGISRKLPDTERSRLKGVLKRIVPDDAGVIVRTAAEGASEEALQRDIDRLVAQWQEISAQTETASAPAQLYAEPDLTVRVVRDIFNEDFSKLIVSGDEAWSTVGEYVEAVAPDLADRVSRWTDSQDAFGAHRVDEQLAKALDRKVWLPSGGYLIIEPTEAMTVIDVNTGKFTGSGGNLEETVTKNNIEAAEEIVRQLRLRDVGGIIVIDFIDMVLESNRELVLRRLLECLGRDRTKHQVAEVTSLGLVQMTRKRVGQGLLEAFSTSCEACQGRGRHVHTEPVESPTEGERGRKGREPTKKAAKGKTPRKRAAKAPAVDVEAANEAVKKISAATLRAASKPEDGDAPAAESTTEPTEAPAGEAAPDAAPDTGPEPAPAV